MNEIRTSADLPSGAREWYLRHLTVLVRAIVVKHGPMTVGAIHEMANHLIARHGVRDAHKFV